MHERAADWSGVVSLDDDLEREFEARLTECSTLAFRVAFSVLRHREDAEDIAQEAFAKAYRSFHQLRERDRFRAWPAQSRRQEPSRIVDASAIPGSRGASRQEGTQSAASTTPPLTRAVTS